jgi:hypothetical protein
MLYKCKKKKNIENCSFRKRTIVLDCNNEHTHPPLETDSIQKVLATNWENEWKRAYETESKWNFIEECIRLLDLWGMQRRYIDDLKIIRHREYTVIQDGFIIT